MSSRQKEMPNQGEDLTRSGSDGPDYWLTDAVKSKPLKHQKAQFIAANAGPKMIV